MHMTRITVTFYKLFEQLALDASISNTYSVLSLMNNYDRLHALLFFFYFLKSFIAIKKEIHILHTISYTVEVVQYLFFKIKIYQ